MKIPIVNEHDEIIGYKDKKDRNTIDIIRVSILWVKNSKEEILLAQRSKKKIGSGRWGAAVAGTVEEGETYESNIIKESLEEIGLDLKDYIIGPKLKIKGDPDSSMNMSPYFVQVYIKEIDKNAEDFIIDKNEVEKVKWFTKNQIRELVKDPEKVTNGLATHSEVLLNL